MPIYMIERNFAEKLEVTPEGAAEINEINDEESVRWLISFLSIDKKKTFCLYEASSAEAILEAARRAGIPADTIIELSGEIVPSGLTHSVQMERFAEP
jgi:Nickel responsive protein SCO4226-like